MAKPQLDALRAQIDQVDAEILALMQKRMAIVHEVAQAKRAEGVSVRDPVREAAILDQRRQRAGELGLSADFVESLFRLIMWSSREYQSSLRAGVPLDSEPKTIAVIGGLGGLGRRLCDLFLELGNEVLVADLNTELSAVEAAQRADVTVIAVPIAITERVIREVGPHVPEHGLLMDITSIKGAPMAAMLAATKASVIGTHPMFGPGVHNFQNQRVVLCRGRGDAWASWVEATFRARGIVITSATAEEHDRAMALVQVLTHYQTQVLGLTLARLGAPLSEGLKFTSPAYLMELYVAARHFGQDPALYGPIEMENPRTAQITAAFLSAAATVQSLLLTRDQAGFAAMFDEVRAFFGSFSDEATEKSKFLIDRLVERS
ncbi:MAG TPA: bifunctional chorismate mutase/prephenate dehydrogenase [Polyangiales bacterium]|nr:bifunctional chorismate mutase/prephenate dehydrogenase [Polyangiales bacterium]